jgi:N-glycosylase/DNA lyase
MTLSTDSNMRHRLDSTIRVLCPLIEDRIKSRVTSHWCEYDLRKELIGCIMGSQVRHEMAVAATKNMEHAGLLDNSYWVDFENEDFEFHVLNVLAGQANNLPHSGSYRFPKARSKQLAKVRNALARVPLDVRLGDDKAAKHLRKNLVADIPGLGPKQASMFLRNTGRSYDLAILDTHVLRFMDMQALLPLEQARIGTVKGYEMAEGIAVEYAETLGYPAGYLDWAIWATMKAARELGL